MPGSLKPLTPVSNARNSNFSTSGARPRRPLEESNSQNIARYEANAQMSESQQEKEKVNEKLEEKNAQVRIKKKLGDEEEEDEAEEEASSASSPDKNARWYQILQAGNTEQIEVNIPVVPNETYSFSVEVCGDQAPPPMNDIAPNAANEDPADYFDTLQVRYPIEYFHQFLKDQAETATPGVDRMSEADELSFFDDSHVNPLKRMLKRFENAIERKSPPRKNNVPLFEQLGKRKEYPLYREVREFYKRTHGIFYLQWVQMKASGLISPSVSSGSASYFILSSAPESFSRVEDERMNLEPVDFLANRNHYEGKSEPEVIKILDKMIKECEVIEISDEEELARIDWQPEVIVLDEKKPEPEVIDISDDKNTVEIEAMINNLSDDLTKSEKIDSLSEDMLYRHQVKNLAMMSMSGSSSDHLYDACVIPRQDQVLSEQQYTVYLSTEPTSIYSGDFVLDRGLTNLQMVEVANRLEIYKYEMENGRKSRSESTPTENYLSSSTVDENYLKLSGRPRSCPTLRQRRERSRIQAHLENDTDEEMDECMRNAEFLESVLEVQLDVYEGPDGEVLEDHGYDICTLMQIYEYLHLLGWQFEWGEDPLHLWIMEIHLMINEAIATNDNLVDVCLRNK